MLVLETLTCAYGEAVVVENVDLSVNAKEVVALIGSNGAGKTSTIQAIAGHVPIRSGRILLHGTDLRDCSPKERAVMGISLAPEGRRLFADLTVHENLVVGGFCRPKASTAGNMARVLGLFPGLHKRMNAIAGTLSGGEQQMVAIGRALMAEPRLLLIDELSLGLMPLNVDICYRAVEQLRSEGIGILLVEQNLSRALEASTRVYVMESGHVVWSGESSAARRDSGLMDRYLGLQP